MKILLMALKKSLNYQSIQVYGFYAWNMSGSQIEETKDAIYEFASFLYGLYMDSFDEGIIEDGQNNAKQNNTN